MSELQILEMVERTNKLLKENYQQKHTLGAVGTTADHRPLYENGFFQDCSLDRALMNTVVKARESIANMIPVRPSIYVDQKFGFITGNSGTVDFTGTVVDAGSCEACVELVEDLDACKIQYPFGKMCIDTKTLETNELIRRACLRQYDDFFITCDTRGVSAFPSPSFGDDGNEITQGAVRRQLHRMTQAFQNAAVNKIWTGDPANSIAGNQYKEFWGIDNLIIGDWTAAGTPTKEALNDADKCSALNADVKDFGSECIGGGVNSIYEYLQELEDTLWQRAEGIGCTDIDWRIYMISPLWSELSKAWGCEMAGDGCTGGADVMPNDGGNGLFNMDTRRELQRTRTLELNGRRYPVFTDPGIPYTMPTATSYESSIYFIPFNVNGEPVLYWEHMDYSQLASELAAIPGSMTDMMGWTDGGRFHMSIVQERHCFLINGKVEARLIFKAPHLSGRIDNVISCPLQAKPLYLAPDGSLTGQLAT